MSCLAGNVRPRAGPGPMDVWMLAWMLWPTSFPRQPLDVRPAFESLMARPQCDAEMAPSLEWKCDMQMVIFTDPNKAEHLIAMTGMVRQATAAHTRLR